MLPYGKGHEVPGALGLGRGFTDRVNDYLMGVAS
jgi:hypothetical protein